jgi:hypothetical protein
MNSNIKFCFYVFLLTITGCKEDHLKVTNFGDRNFNVTEMLIRDSFIDFRITSDFKYFDGEIYFLNAVTQDLVDSIPLVNTTNASSYISTLNMNSHSYFSAIDLKFLFRVSDFEGRVYFDTITGENPYARGARSKVFKSISGLLAYWPLGSDVLDYSGNGQHATINGNVIFQKTPNQKFDAALFNGNSSLTVPHSNNLNPNTFSISAYITPTTINDFANMSVIISKREGDGWGNGFECNIGTTDKKSYTVGAGWTNTAGNNGFVAPNLIWFNSPTHVIYTHDKDSAKLYLNGKNWISIKSNGVINNNNTLPVTIGRRGNGYHPFTGYINDVAVWNKALSPKDIADISYLFK